MLSCKQVSALSLSLSGMNVSDIAKALEIDRGTIHRWMRTKEFRSEYNRSIRTIFRESQERIFSIQEKAVAALVELLSSNDAEIRFKACKLALESGHTAYIALDDVAHAEHCESEAELMEPMEPDASLPNG